MSRATTYQQTTWHTTLLSQVISSEHKVILLGTAGVGKTAFFLRVRDGEFKQSEATCFPADYLVKTIRVPDRSCKDASLKVNRPQHTTSALHRPPYIALTYSADHPLRHGGRGEIQEFDFKFLQECSRRCTHVRSG